MNRRHVSRPHVHPADVGIGDIEFTLSRGPVILRAGKWKLHRNRLSVSVGGTMKIGSP